MGTSVDEGQTWQPLMRYDQIAAIQACVHASCQTDCMNRAAAGQWDDTFCAATAPVIDAGTPPDDAGPTGTGGAGGTTGTGGAGGADAGLVPPDKSGCGCGVGDGGTPGGLLLMIAVVVGAVRRRRARRV